MDERLRVAAQGAWDKFSTWGTGAKVASWIFGFWILIPILILKTHWPLLAKGLALLFLLAVFIANGYTAAVAPESYVTPSQEVADGYISESSFDGEWPFTVSNGILECEEATVLDRPAEAIYFTANGTRYAINGTAKTVSDAPDVDPIWANAGGGLKINIGDVIQQGISMCG